MTVGNLALSWEALKHDHVYFRVFQSMLPLKLEALILQVHTLEGRCMF